MRQSEEKRTHLSKIMVGDKEEHFAILEALKGLFQPFQQHSLHVAA